MKQPHILCETSDIAPRVLLPGDPARVLRIAESLSEVREIAFNREFRTVTGKYNDVPVTVTSTGIGGASALIAMEELIACGGRTFIRIGSSGALQKGIRLGDLIIPTGAVREDGASRMYIRESFPAVADYKLVGMMAELCRSREYSFHVGITRSHDSLYIDHAEELLKKWSSAGVLASDMETASIFTLASLRGVRAASILNNVVVYGEDVGQGIGNYVDEETESFLGEKHEIDIALEVITSSEAV